MLFKKTNKKEAINTASLPGFADLLPAEQIAFNKMKNKIESVYKKFGFIPMDNPVIERANILFAKAGGDTEKEIYRIQKGDNELALRFDLTVPLARFVSENYNVLNFPFRRYQIARSYRGERPQKGRFREFYQADIDIIGDGVLDLKNDAEIPSIIYSTFQSLNLGPFVIKISNRKILSGFLESVELENKSTEILRAIDKLEKIGTEKVYEMLKKEDISKEDIEKIFKIFEIKGSNKEILDKLRKLDVNSELFNTGVEELETVIKYLENFGVPFDYVKIDLSVVRGLDYYTGTVYETFLVDYPEIGSVCAGGRYDNLVGDYSDKKLPGVGISIGLTRLFSQLQDKGLIKTEEKTPTQLLVVPLTQDFAPAIKVASNLRKQNINTEIFLEDTTMKKKLNYANKQNIPYILIIGDDEIKSGKYALKNMITGEQVSVSEEEIVQNIKI